ncbi:MAG: hypothetical protein V2I43_28950, partial [Parvularcula sp.]|nr:hypothetical protein [Parvularcula sp.]
MTRDQVSPYLREAFNPSREEKVEAHALHLPEQMRSGYRSLQEEERRAIAELRQEQEATFDQRSQEQIQKELQRSTAAELKPNWVVQPSYKELLRQAEDRAERKVQQRD